MVIAMEARHARSMATENQERLVELEIRIAHQDRLIGALDDVVRSFAARVERLEHQLDTLRRSVGDVGPVGQPDEPPPHY
jgi:uncharacterized coiled-coil protein SlyX